MRPLLRTSQRRDRWRTGQIDSAGQSPECGGIAAPRIGATTAMRIAGRSEILTERFVPHWNPNILMIDGIQTSGPTVPYAGE